MLDIAGTRRSVKSNDGTELGVIETGPVDGPVALLVHGFVSTAAAWTLVTRQLVDAGYRVVVMEQRAHGTSGVGHEGLRLLPLGDDLAAVLETIDADQVTLVGHSMGTIATFALAQQRPDVLKERVRHFVGASALHRGRGKPTALELKKHILYTKPYDWARRQRPLGVVCTASALGPHAGYTLIEATYDMYLEAGPEVIEHLGRELLTFDYGHVLESFDVETTLLVGSADTKTPPRMAREMASLLPRASLVELEGVGHMTPLETPDAIVAAILSA